MVCCGTVFPTLPEMGYGFNKRLIQVGKWMNNAASCYGSFDTRLSTGNVFLA